MFSLLLCKVVCLPFFIYCTHLQETVQKLTTPSCTTYFLNVSVWQLVSGPMVEGVPDQKNSSENKLIDFANKMIWILPPNTFLMCKLYFKYLHVQEKVVIFFFSCWPLSPFWVYSISAKVAGITERYVYIWGSVPCSRVRRQCSNGILSLLPEHLQSFMDTGAFTPLSLYCPLYLILFK